jgi:hypothetical protein
MPADFDVKVIRKSDPIGQEIDDDDDLDTPEHEESEGEGSLDSEKSIALLAKLKQWLQHERDVQRDNRVQMAIDEDYYDSIQWTEEEIEVLNSRGQRPVVINEIGPAIDWILGTERKTAVDWRVLPRGPEDHGGSMAMTKLCKFVSDVNKAKHCMSDAFSRAVKAGLGWLECGARNDWEDDPLFVRSEDWRNIWHDSMFREVDAQDMRYLFRARILDFDIASAMFPDRIESLEQVAADVTAMPSADDEYEVGLGSGSIRPGDTEVDGQRKVVRVWECWYKEPGTVKMLRGGRYSGMQYDESNQSHVDQLEKGLTSTFDSIQLVVKFACFADRGDLLLSKPTPYRHNRIPFIPVQAYRFARDGAFYGVIRRQRDPQDGLNKRRSKSDFLLSVNRIIMDKGAVDDVDYLRDEAARPDAVIEKNEGKELRMENNLQLAGVHIQIEERDAAYIRQVSGVTGENLGLNTNATSGRAIIARQEQGNVVLAPLYDNKMLAFQMMGEMIISMIGQFYTDERVIRIGVGKEKDEMEWLEINRWQEDDGIFKNDMTATAADFIVATQDYRESMRQAFFESMMEMLGKFPPDIAIRMLDLVVGMSDIPNKDEFVDRIRELVNPPKESAPPPDPVREAQAKKILADAGLSDAKTKRERLMTMKEALESASTLAGAPALARIADDLIRELGNEAEDDAQIALGEQPIPAEPPIPQASQGVPEQQMTPEQQAQSQLDAQRGQVQEQQQQQTMTQEGNPNG